MKLAISGTRFTTKKNFVFEKLDEIKNKYKIDLFISGHAKGVDSFGEEWAEKNNIPIKKFPPDWRGLGKKAGFVRNAEMIKEAEILIGFPLLPRGESHGTEFTISLGQEKGIPVYIFPIDEDKDAWK